MSVNLGPTGLIGTGQVLQVIRAMSSTVASRNSATYGEITAAYRIGITPKLSTSKLIIEFSFNTSMATHHHTSSFKIIQIGSGAYIGESTPSSGSRPAGHASVRGQYNGDNACNVVARTVVSSSSTSARTYGLAGRNSASINIGSSQVDRSDPWGWACPVVMTITEIQA